MKLKINKMREIKFRGKRKDDGEWIIGNIQVPKPPFDKYFMWDSHNFQQEVNPETVGQFTGLKDKNGVEVFEEDYDEDGNIVVFCQNCNGWQFGQIDIPTKEIVINCHNCEGNFMFQDISDFEIVGNIHDKY